MKSKIKRAASLILTVALSSAALAQTKDASQDPHIESNPLY